MPPLFPTPLLLDIKDNYMRNIHGCIPVTLHKFLQVLVSESKGKDLFVRFWLHIAFYFFKTFFEIKTHKKL